MRFKFNLSNDSNDDYHIRRLTSKEGREYLLCRLQPDDWEDKRSRAESKQPGCCNRDCGMERDGCRAKSL